MKTHIHTLQDTLAYQLQGLYYAEKKIREEAEQCLTEITSKTLKEYIRSYVAGAEGRLQKLDRIFNYLMQEPEARKNRAVSSLLDDSRELLAFTDSPHLKDIIMVSCLQNINAFKISSLKIAYMFTAELELDTASDLLQQLLELEMGAARTLSGLAIEEFNKGHELTAA